jgi:PAS domain S-box-containing protein
MTDQTEPWKILVVDDEENIRMAVERILIKIGCQVFQAGNGHEALQIVEAQDIVLVILDLKMPGMDGLEVQRHIREIDESVQIIIITGYATIETAIEAMRQGAYDFIPKPFETDHLRLVVRRALHIIYLQRERERLEEDRRKTLFDLSTEKSRTRTIMEALPNGVMVTNNQGQIVLMNQAVKDQFNLNSEQAIGECVEHSVEDSGLCHFIKQTIEQADHNSHDSPTYEFEGANETFLLVKARSIVGEEGEYLGSVFVFVDISAIKKLDRLKSEFVAKVSHELRSPLSIIHEQMALVVQDMIDQASTDRDQQILSRAQEKTKGLISLVEDLLNLSRLEAGAAFQDIQPVKVDLLLEEIVQSFDPQARQSNQNLQLSFESRDFCLVQADRKALESVFTNLIGNALKYTPEGGNIRVFLTSLPDHLEIRVQDDGFGISPQDQERIFERFYRVKNEKTRFISGTGLGLPIVKGILDDFRGTIALESELNTGSTFIVTLPLGDVEREQGA